MTMSLTLQENDSPQIKVNAADSSSNSSSGYDVKRHAVDDGMLAHAATSTGSAFDPTTIRRTSQDEALFQQVARPLPMTQLQTDFMAKTMLEIRKSYAASSSNSSNIGHHKRQKTETMANSSRCYNTDDSDNGGNNNEDESSHYQEYDKYDNGGSNSSSDNDEDDDSVSLSSLALPRPSFDILNELETHPKTKQFVATAGGLITHCK